MKSSFVEAKKELKKLANPIQAEILQRFFKTGRGQYGEGDIFLGVKVPQTRKVAKQFRELPLAEVEKLLHSKIHEERLLALLILIQKFQLSGEGEQRKIYRLYLKNLKGTCRVGAQRFYAINNWDLVDLSAPQIVGTFLLDKNRSELYRLARSKHLWSRRVAMISTFAFIKKQQFDDSLKLAEILLTDKHDLIHKAVGWMLREVGKRDLVAEENFLKKYAGTMPRTALRYAIEKFPPVKRQFYLKYGSK
ncbi:MAG: DNA alkylation repair protein [Candidatus Paceibacterota bacterium]|jgi:3-methyladenine DNA glycosylase AlkD